MKEFIFTFGQAHTDPKGYSLAHKYIAVRGDDWWDARQKVLKKYGNHWAFQYRTRSAAGVDRYGLEEVPF